jgi:hypothetical protein
MGMKLVRVLWRKRAIADDEIGLDEARKRFF